MKICFLGAAGVGKSTFLSALTCMTPDSKGAYCRFPMEKSDGSPNEGVKSIRQAADAIRRGEIIPATTVVRDVAARLSFPDLRRSLDVEFIDLPGSTFSMGYDESDAASLAEIRNHVNACSCIYFFIEPQDLARDKGESRILTFLNVLRDYKAKNGKNKDAVPPLVCLTLTKADAVSISENEAIHRGEASPVDVKKYFEEHAGSNLAALEREVGINYLFYAAFSSVRGGRLNLNTNEFTQLFKPLVKHIDDVDWWDWIKKILLWCLGVLAVCGLLWGIIDAITDIKRKEQKDIIEQLNRTDTTPESYKTKRELIERIEDTVIQKNAREKLEQEIEKQRGELSEQIRTAKEEYYRSPILENKRHYNKLTENYVKNFPGHPLPEDLKIDPRIEEIPIIDKILHVQNVNDSISAYLSARSSVIEEYLEQISGNGAEVGEIRHALDTARILCEPRDYTMYVDTNRLDGDNRLAFYVQTKVAPGGELYPEDEEGAVKDAGFKKQAEFHENILFEWQAGTHLELHVWDNNYHWTSFDGRIVSYDRLAIGRFCGLQSCPLSDPQKDWHKGIRVSTRIYCDGQEIKKESVDSVEKYIFGNGYWEQRKDYINSQLNR